MRQFTTWETLQALIGTTSEGADLDFKERLDPKEAQIQIECAKDVAALANVLGGHLLVGVSTEMGRTRCKGFHGIDKLLAAEISQIFEEAVKERARPSPRVSVRSIEVPNTPRIVVVVAVEPSPIAPVGVSLRQQAGGHLVDSGWIFPYRVGSLTQYLHPDQFGVYESMSTRRSAAILQSIPDEQRKMLVLRWMEPVIIAGGPMSRPSRLDVALSHVKLEENVACFLMQTDQKTTTTIAVPLDDIASIWRSVEEPGGWQVSVRGLLRNDGRHRWEYSTTR